MAGEEMRKAMEFLLNQQAQLTIDVGRLDAAIKEMRIQAEEDRKFVREVIHEMARGIAVLSVNADADRQEIIKLGVSAEADRRRMEADRQEFRNTIRQMKEQAEEDRRSTREMITLVVEQANADRAVIQAVVKEVHIVNERFTRLESQSNRPQ
jgi:hypothetical protein